MTELVAIVNVTPDSFSDGGESATPEAAIAHIRRAFAEGAAVVDVGAQSTRPGAAMLSAEEEWSRLAPLLSAAVAVAREYGGKLSVDTFRPPVAERALAAGADWINDVGGFENPEMVAAVRRSRCSLVVMHALGIPADPSAVLDAGIDPVKTVFRDLQARVEHLEKAGIARERLILDPGIGFGKTPMQSLELILRAGELRHPLDAPLLYGHSRKSFLTLFTAAPPPERDDLTLAFSAVLIAQNVRYLRVHHIPRHAALLDRYQSGGRPYKGDCGSSAGA